MNLLQGPNSFLRLGLSIDDVRVVPGRMAKQVLGDDGCHVLVAEFVDGDTSCGLPKSAEDRHALPDFARDLVEMVHEG